MNTAIVELARHFISTLPYKGNLSQYAAINRKYHVYVQTKASRMTSLLYVSGSALDTVSRYDVADPQIVLLDRFVGIMLLSHGWPRPDLLVH